METVELTRDCEAVQIPGGDTVTLGSGTPVDVTHALGGTYTIRAGSGLFRVNPGDADALGKEVVQSSMPDSETVTKDDVLEALRDVYDPEIPVNIVDLGLVYGVEVADGDVDVSMTLTFAGCGMGPYIAQQAEWRLAEVEGVEDINVDLVFDPPWTPDMITEEGKRLLGLD
jgi:probable FeS assembly SUF system protein SufT